MKRNSASKSENQYQHEWFQWLRAKGVMQQNLGQSHVFENKTSGWNVFRRFLILLSTIIIILILTIAFYTFFYPRFSSLFDQDTQLDDVGSQILPFRATLMDKDGVPIVDKSDITFSLYNSIDSQESVYTGQCFGSQAIEPDFQGEFTVVLGADCGMEPIPFELVSSDNPLYLGIQVGDAPEIVPRYQVQTMMFSQGARTLDGSPKGKTMGTIPFIDEENTIEFQDADPILKSTDGTLSVIGPSLSLKADDPQVGDITIIPGVSRYTLIPFGNVGIGTIAPQSKLDVIGAFVDTPLVRLVNVSDSDDAAEVLSLGMNRGAEQKGTFITFRRNSSSTEEGEVVGAIDVEGNRLIYRTSGADYAEYFDSVESIPQNYIVGLSSQGIRKAQQGDVIVGVVTTSAGFVGNSKGRNSDNTVLVGLMGQIDVLVSNENGDIDISDPIEVSHVSGMGRKGGTGQIVGHALHSTSELNDGEYSSDICTRGNTMQYGLDGKKMKCAIIPVLIK